LVQGLDDGGGARMWVETGGDEDVGVDNEVHVWVIIVEE
jgi:hypothetical protein